MVLFGAALYLRTPAPDPVGKPEAGASGGRIWLALVLCVGYAAGLLGRGLPFWLTSAGFMFVAILVFRWLDRDAEDPSSMGRIALGSAVIALAASAATSLLFQEVFLVRLP